MSIITRTKDTTSRDDALDKAAMLSGKAVYLINNGKADEAHNTMIKALEIHNANTTVTERHTQNARIAGSSGIGGSCDFAANEMPAYDMQYSPAATRFEMERLYKSDWQSQKIIDIPVDDMLRKSFEYTGIDDGDAKKLYRYQDKLRMYEVLRQALRLERLYGGSVIMLGLRDAVDDPSEPVDISKIGPEDLQFMNAVDRTYIGILNMQTDVTKADYGRPQMYEINGHSVHVSRLLIFNGDPISSLDRTNAASGFYRRNDGFGYPILARLITDLQNATGSRQAAMHLIERASVMVFKGDIQSASAFKDANNNLDSLKTLLNNVSNYKAALINSSPGSEASLETVAANFGSIPELLMSYLQVLSAAVDIPATRFLGQAPGGLNATGESDLENYYSNITAKQQHRLKPQIVKLLSYLVPSAGLNENVDDIEILFPPLEVQTPLEEAQIRQIDTQNVVALTAGGIISYEEAIEEMKQRDVLITDPEDFPDPVIPTNFDNDDLNETGDFNKSIDKLRGKDQDDDRTAKQR